MHDLATLQVLVDRGNQQSKYNALLY